MKSLQSLGEEIAIANAESLAAEDDVRAELYALFEGEPAFVRYLLRTFGKGSGIENAIERLRDATVVRDKVSRAWLEALRKERAQLFAEIGNKEQDA